MVRYLGTGSRMLLTDPLKDLYELIIKLSLNCHFDISV